MTLRVYATPTWLWLSVPIVFTLGGGYYFFQTPEAIAKIFIIVGVPVAWFISLTDPTQAYLDAHDLVLKGLLKTTRIAIGDIEIIERGNRGTRVIHRNGTIVVANLARDMDELWVELQRRNPAIIVRLDFLARFAQSPRNVFLLALAITLGTLGIVALMIALRPPGN
jgi:hypothetical protein